MQEYSKEAVSLCIIDTLCLPKELGRAILQTKEDVVLFVGEFYMKNNFVANDLLDFKAFKVKDNNYSLEQFTHMYKTEGILNSFKKMFLQDFTYSDVSIIKSVILDGRLTIEQLYTRFMNNIHKNIMRYVMCAINY